MKVRSLKRIQQIKQRWLVRQPFWVHHLPPYKKRAAKFSLVCVTATHVEYDVRSQVAGILGYQSSDDMDMRLPAEIRVP